MCDSFIVGRILVVILFIVFFMFVRLELKNFLSESESVYHLDQLLSVAYA